MNKGGEVGMILQVKIQDLRMMLNEKCEELITDKKLAYQLYWRICGIEEDPRFVDVTDTVVENAPTVVGWISVKDRLPEKETDVLLKFDNAFAVGGRDDNCWYVSCGNDWYTTLDEDEAKPTHWMPLPEPPIAMDEQQNRSFADAQDDRGSGSNR